MKLPFVLYNGIFFSSDEAIFHSNNRAFLYGDGFFETIFVNGKKAPYLKQHIDRIVRAAKTLNLDLGLSFCEEYFIKQIEKFFNKNKYYKGARLRITIFRSGEGKFYPESNNASFLFSGEKLPYDYFILNSKGLNLCFVKDDFLGKTQTSWFKSLNSFPYINAIGYAKKNGFDDCIILNSQNEMIEASSSNVFVVSNKNIVTPSLNSGCVDGVLRRIIIEFCNKNQIKISESDISKKDILNAEEVFLTNAVCGIRWVTGIENVRFYNSLSKKIFSCLNLK